MKWVYDGETHPDTGKLLWRHTFGMGSPLGGNHWGVAIDGERVFVPINDPFPESDDFRIQRFSTAAWKRTVGIQSERR